MDQINSIARNNIKLYRKMRKMTQKELAEALDVTHSSVSAWEIGKNSIDMERLNDICRILNVSLVEILTENEDEEKVQKDEENKQLIEYVERRPEVKRLLKTTMDSRSDDVVVAIKLLEALKKR
ncbi:helix-turn-helix transcriptional regulator [Clostridiales bacterium BAD-6]|uniref:Helix-turn-helix transcriptional regulator n=2 Tax=Sinanaerobacter chloroacetimidivorans TaxID=2818044 RepID=A0A8J7W1L0_9FIRM|nr:helix-turn-helix transcriptional regulator [Sinanaerobacter chloroacetimidivorans]